MYYPSLKGEYNIKQKILKSIYPTNTIELLIKDHLLERGHASTHAKNQSFKKISNLSALCTVMSDKIILLFAYHALCIVT